MSTENPENSVAGDSLHFKVLGRTLEHFGVQMYKRREAAIAELVSNAWDAGATQVHIALPDPETYSPLTSSITIRDNGWGMSFGQVKDEYLVLGRNRRKTPGGDITLVNVGTNAMEQVSGEDSPESGESGVPNQPSTRRVMGRKGIGKLAGFGLARRMLVTTWQSSHGIEFLLDLKDLKQEDDVQADVKVEWSSIHPRLDLSNSGTLITLDVLKHKSALLPSDLALSLARRFSRTVRGSMEIFVNGELLPDATPPLVFRYPKDAGTYATEILEDGNTVKYWYGFAEGVIKQREQRGFSILVNGKVAQAPPFFFDVEATASGQHSTRYVIGEIEADYLDAGSDDESDVVSTDRQELDWEELATEALLTWGRKKSREVLRECSDFKGNRFVEEVYEDPGLRERITRLDQVSQRQIKDFLRILGLREGDDRTLELASSLVKAYEFRYFHDVINEIQDASKDPEELAKFLARLSDWKTLESRAILELIQGRLDIIDTFERLLYGGAPETAPFVGGTNLHDAVARFPWLLNPDWQVLAEEKTISKQLREWGEKDVDPNDRERYDFIALASDELLIIIELKRSNHAVRFDELQRLLGYKERLSKSRPNVQAVLVYGGGVDISEAELRAWTTLEDRSLKKWSELFSSSRSRYTKYRAILEADINHPDFGLASRDVANTRHVLNEDTFYRGKEGRKEGIGIQEADFTKE